MPNTALWKPSGNGGLSGASSTKWRSGTGISASRPGRARSASIIFVFSRKNRAISIRYDSVEQHRNRYAELRRLRVGRHGEVHLRLGAEHRLRRLELRVLAAGADGVQRR